MSFDFLVFYGFSFLFAQLILRSLFPFYQHSGSSSRYQYRLDFLPFLTHRADCLSIRSYREEGAAHG